jgi:lipoic acid synthetase
MDPGTVTKSGIIVGMGESTNEVLETMEDLREVGCGLLTIGQYLRPSGKHLPVARFYTPDEFTELREAGEAMGFKHVASGPLVRSSYHAGEQHSAALTHAAEK